jgi:hypothetical protein
MWKSLRICFIDGLVAPSFTQRSYGTFVIILIYLATHKMFLRDMPFWVKLCLVVPWERVVKLIQWERIVPIRSFSRES